MKSNFNKNFEKWLEENFKDEYTKNNSGTPILKTYEWTTGGTWGNCWGEKGTCEPGTPRELDSLDSYLEKNHSNMTFLQFRKLERECISTHEGGESDWYGGHRDTMWKECDLKKLHNFFIVLYDLDSDIL